MQTHNRMKKFIFLLLCTATLGLVSCKKDNIVQEETQNKTIIFDITPDKWVLSADQLTYSAEFNNLPEIDDFGVEVEGHIVSISLPNFTSYQQLPYVYDVDAYSYSVYNNGIAIDIQSSDLQNRAPRKPASTIRVKVVIVASRDATND